MAVVMNKEQIMEVIPHRDPFLLIDEINELEVGKRVKATKYIKADDFWFKGHFPQYPVTPGVLMVEMCAQAGAVALLSLPENKGKHLTLEDRQVIEDGIRDGLGCRAIRVTKKEELDSALKEALSANGPVVVECVIDDDDKVFPMVSPGTSIEDVFDEKDFHNQD